ncbi:RagB/SusD family nutrient uptake outer membrane protein [Flavisolibacter ginsenosidimutans]|uniref:RagB/SusD family nutrient uptake outer membrane protein n=1 Tax=Flavisolibacter ginsenosidimutans TaxID=661481 RepID=A0A5B8UDA0_9BACT|nr:RagB/SusD family nutrient uptake outer membrane protein [Flavisolibacter ginsenosidimutans]QEC54478.1 RagB/SusD family nutrient uptake outer membrane protein [Flavisolibacter ginsenosidimutans]
MKFNKSFLFASLCVVFAGSLVSCKKQLEDVVPQDSISKQLALTDANATQTLYIGVYARFRAFNSTFFNLGEMRSDIWTDGLFTESADPTSQQLYTQNISALNVPYANWAGFYNLIYNINNVIDVLPKSPVTDPDKSRWLAEMYGLRAYVYYTMLKTWGGVPLTTEPVVTINNAAETYKARSAEADVMKQIKSDIDKSLQLFNGNNAFPSGNRVYWNRVATLTLKGDVYIWSGTNTGGGAADYTTAKAALQEVKNLEGATLKLDANYADIFDPAKKANNPEIIFALSYESGQATQGAFSIFTVNGVQASSYSLAPAATPTVNTVYPYVNGANRVGMNQAMITRLTSGPADQRIANSLKVMYSAASPFPVRGVLLTKWIGTVSGTSQVYNNDYPVYRYADVLLLLAEAKAKLGEDPTAEIMQIRQRAYGAAAPAFTNGSITDNMNAILEEYLREFIGEGKRWWALRRAGDSYVYAAIKPSYLSPTSTAKLLLPISTSMINNDPLLAQTPGY